VDVHAINVPSALVAGDHFISHGHCHPLGHGKGIPIGKGHRFIPKLLIDRGIIDAQARLIVAPGVLGAIERAGPHACVVNQTKLVMHHAILKGLRAEYADVHAGGFHEPPVGDSLAALGVALVEKRELACGAAIDDGLSSGVIRKPRGRQYKVLCGRLKALYQIIDGDGLIGTIEQDLDHR
jgi:hypothetical protein